MNIFLKRLQSLNGIVASVSTLIPGITFFFKYSPPLIGGLSILITALSVAFVWLGFKTGTKFKRGSNAFKFIICGFILSIIYWVCLDLTSIYIQSPNGDIRYQVGFNLAEWSLEQSALENIGRGICPQNSKKDLLLCYSASTDNIYLIWKRWTVYLFGIINVITFTSASVLWCFGWGRLLKTVK